MCETESNRSADNSDGRERERWSDCDDVAGSYPLQESVAEAEGWGDPQLDDYNDYDAPRVRDIRP
jgi:hypothetical protein